MEGLVPFHYHVAEQVPDEIERAPALRGMRTIAPEGTDIQAGFASDEAAARHHLAEIFAADARPTVRGITAPEKAEQVPDLRLVDVQDLPGTDTHLVRFEQTRVSIPVFGGHAVCELDQNRGLVSARGEVAHVEGVSPTASVSPEEALAKVAEFADVDLSQLTNVDPPQLNFFRDPENVWRLIWLFRLVPAAPTELVKHSHGHGLGPSPREHNPLVDYLIDAHDGEVVFYYSAMPLLDAPTFMRGIGEDGLEKEFFGQSVADDVFELADPLHDIATYDLQFGDIESTTLTEPVRHAVADLGDTRKAVVSAHDNATIVDQFFRSVLQRDGIDNKGMRLINVVNCTYPRFEEPPVWHNAVWYGDRMWYGQAPGDDGALCSYARFLDVIAHELTHGITQHTSDLVYKDQSGALNESFSDIIGIIVRNWDETRPHDGGQVDGWNWDLGPGLGESGAPLRDLEDPTSTNDPDHMNQYWDTDEDSGGVHRNSNIHNKAAYNVMTATLADGSRAFTPRESAYLFYLALTRLGRLSGFSDALQSVVDVAATMWRGDADECLAKVNAIRAAYASVGIE
jgi:Zn-dependent metalloprotease